MELLLGVFVALVGCSLAAAVSGVWAVRQEATRAAGAELEPGREREIEFEWSSPRVWAESSEVEIDEHEMFEAIKRQRMAERRDGRRKRVQSRRTRVA